MDDHGIQFAPPRVFTEPTRETSRAKESDLSTKVDHATKEIFSSQSTPMSEMQGKTITQTPKDSHKVAAVQQRVLTALSADNKKSLSLDAAKQKQEIQYKELELAIHRGDVAMIRKLHQEGADINHTENGKTLLHLAAASGDPKLIEVLLECNAKLETKDSYGKTALECAINRGFEAAALALMNHGASVQPSFLHKAAELGKNRLLEALLKKGIDPNSPDSEQQTPLHQSSQKGHASTMRLLLEYGADPNCMNSNAETPLHIAAKHGHVEVVDLLLSFESVVVNVPNIWDSTPLHEACAAGYEGIATLLALEGADLEARDSDGYTPLDLAIKDGHEEVLQALMTVGLIVLSPTSPDPRSIAG